MVLRAARKARDQVLGITGDFMSRPNPFNVDESQMEFIHEPILRQTRNVLAPFYLLLCTLSSCLLPNIYSTFI